MLMLITFFVSACWFLMGIYGLYNHHSWLSHMDASYTEHTGRLTHTRFHYKTDHNQYVGRQFHSVTFQLEGESWEYSIIIPKGSRLVWEKLLRDGDEVELAYVTPDINPPKRRVWYLAQNGQPPLLTADVARAHAEQKNSSVSSSLMVLGLLSMAASLYWFRQ